MQEFDGRTYKKYAFIVDNDVAWIHSVDTQLEQLIAVLESNPIIVEVPESIENEIKLNGWTYSNGVFTAPSE